MSPFVISPLELTIRLLLSLLLGGLIGYERERNNRPAGFRTHILVCLGSTLLMLISVYGFAAFAGVKGVTMDPTRLAAQVIPSIGFLGAGTILRNDFSVTGLTTAASLWVASAIGLAVGAGFYYGAFLVTGMVLLSLYILNKVEKRYFSGKRIFTLKISVVNQPGVLGTVSTLLSARSVSVTRMSVEEETTGDLHNLIIHMSLKLPRRGSEIAHIVEEIQRVDGVTSVAMESV
ncbi:MgtC/SapB family protein [Gorillibacterium timonense]|uniref:MgtC/SapB family protein n=1 Tax=Gorillibacterium timonense TaxID=1689269 RepID=UPI00071E1765|nr:MgtC/SapB family protein [Gorillibacterium timonense]